MLFVFDYDAEWCFTVELVKLGGKKPGSRYPRLLNSSGDAPEQYPEMDDLREDCYRLRQGPQAGSAGFSRRTPEPLGFGVRALPDGQRRL